jgi:hypothetical protein
MSEQTKFELINNEWYQRMPCGCYHGRIKCNYCSGTGIVNSWPQNRKWFCAQGYVGCPNCNAKGYVLKKYEYE